MSTTVSKTKQMNDVRPSYVRELYSSEARQILADYFINIALEWDEEEDEPLTKQDIIDATGVGRVAVMDHLPTLERMGLVNSTEGKRWERYYPNTESDVIAALHVANEELYGSWKERSDVDTANS